ncbi:phage regulatory CII family protein [Pseudomonas segetis]|uniref:Phage regulatory protein CII (CP76) n=1 Tax=Pseudomonas segetis TaxID=298908 RepID=A0A239C8M7_9PSED|nr:phage regulatory CII family protein [Pseudomonas segetis]SNS16299.1 Phage regulatory protein CII (CP76) [Pseudomonas segetis]
MEHIENAVHETVLDAGAKKLAPMIGLSHTALLQRTNPKNDDHKLTLAQFFLINLHSKDQRSLRALAAELGYELAPIQKASKATPMAALMETLRDSASTTQVAMDALADSVLTAQEKRDIETAVAKEMRSLQEFLNAIKSSAGLQQVG